MTRPYRRGLWPVLLLLGGALWAAIGPRPADRPWAPKIAHRGRAATAWVLAADGSKGSGWVCHRGRRWLVTAYHVVGDGDAVEAVFPAGPSARSHYLEHLPRLRTEGRAVRGKVLRRNRDVDLALVELEALPADAVELALAVAPARPGDRVHLVGNRYDTDVLWTYTTGAVLGAHKLREGYFAAGRQVGKGARVVVAGAPINEGDSGAALLDDRGAVVGVAAAVAWEAHGAGLFIDLPEVRAFLGQAPPKDAPPANSDEAPGRGAYRAGVRLLALVQAGDTAAFASACLFDRERRLLLTTAEVIGRQETAEVTFPVFQEGLPVAEAAWYRANADLLSKKGAKVRATVLASDARRNLALLECDSFPAEARSVRFATDVPAIGDAVHALGSVRNDGFLWAYAAGCIRQQGHARLGLSEEGEEPAVLLLQAVLGPGEGGGPVLDAAGNLVGIISGKSAPQQQISYALALSEVQAFLTEQRSLARPRDALAYVQRSGVFVRARRYDRALADLDEAVKLAPRDAMVLTARAFVLHQTGDDRRALAACAEALRHDPKLPAGWCTQAEIECSLGQTHKAIADCDEALRNDRKFARAWAVRGLARLLRGDAAGAVADCDEAVWLDRRLPEALLYRGRAQATLGARDKAIADFTQALRLAPHLAEAHRRRADVYWARSDVAAALEDYSKARELDPNDAIAACGQGRALTARSDHEAALTAFGDAIRLDARHAPAWLGRGAEHLYRGALHLAFADFQEALRIDPTMAVEMMGCAQTRAEEALRGDLRDPALAADICRRAVELVRPELKDRPELSRKAAAALAASAAEPMIDRRAALLLGGVRALHQDLLPSP